MSLGQLAWLRRRGEAPYRAGLARTSARLPRVTAATHGDVVWLDDLPIEAGNFYVMNRGYIDLRRLRPIHQAGAIFVTLERPDVRHDVAASRVVDRSRRAPISPSATTEGMPPAAGPIKFDEWVSTIWSSPCVWPSGPTSGRCRPPPSRNSTANAGRWSCSSAG